VTCAYIHKGPNVTSYLSRLVTLHDLRCSRSPAAAIYTAYSCAILQRPSNPYSLYDFRRPRVCTFGASQTNHMLRIASLGCQLLPGYGSRARRELHDTAFAMKRAATRSGTLSRLRKSISNGNVRFASRSYSSMRLFQLTGRRSSPCRQSITRRECILDFTRDFFM
jgi:hypothetical protein